MIISCKWELFLNKGKIFLILNMNINLEIKYFLIEMSFFYLRKKIKCSNCWFEI